MRNAARLQALRKRPRQPLLWRDKNSVDDMITLANDPRQPRGGTHSISIFNCMTDKYLLFTAHIYGLRMGDDLNSQINLLNNVEPSENGRVVILGAETLTQKRHTSED